MRLCWLVFAAGCLSDQVDSWYDRYDQTAEPVDGGCEAVASGSFEHRDVQVSLHSGAALYEGGPSVLEVLELSGTALEPVGDLDGDGLADLVFFEEQELWVLPGAGASPRRTDLANALGLISNLGLPVLPRGADVDGDGVAEVVFGVGGGVGIYDGPAFLEGDAVPRHHIPHPAGGGAIGLLEADGDGLTDVMLFTSEPDPEHGVLNGRSLYLAADINAGVPEDRDNDRLPRRVGDLNGDGVPEFESLSPLDASRLWDGTLADGPTYDLGAASPLVTWREVALDFPDLGSGPAVLARQSAQPGVRCARVMAHELTDLAPVVDESFVAAAPELPYASVEHHALGDLDGDGLAEGVLVGTRHDWPGVDVGLVSGAALFAGDTELRSRLRFAGTGDDVIRRVRPIGDIDGDGVVDLALWEASR